ncbi:hypothetical protein EJB05_07789, partial [Eragrostis curvula]
YPPLALIGSSVPLRSRRSPHARIREAATAFLKIVLSTLRARSRHPYAAAASPTALPASRSDRLSSDPLPFSSPRHRKPADNPAPPCPRLCRSPATSSLPSTHCCTVHINGSEYFDGRSATFRVCSSSGWRMSHESHPSEPLTPAPRGQRMSHLRLRFFWQSKVPNRAQENTVGEASTVDKRKHTSTVNEKVLTCCLISYLRMVPEHRQPSAWCLDYEVTQCDTFSSRSTKLKRTTLNFTRHFSVWDARSFKEE